MRLAERHFPLPDAETCGGEVSLTFSSLVALNTRKWTRARLDVGLADGLVVVLPVRIELTTSPLPRGKMGNASKCTGLAGASIEAARKMHRPRHSRCRQRPPFSRRPP